MKTFNRGDKEGAWQILLKLIKIGISPFKSDDRNAMEL